MQLPTMLASRRAAAPAAASSRRASRRAAAGSLRRSLRVLAAVVVSLIVGLVIVVSLAPALGRFRVTAAPGRGAGVHVPRDALAVLTPVSAADLERGDIVSSHGA